MGRTNRAQNGPETPAEIPLEKLKQLGPLDRISVCEGLNYARGHAPNPIVEPEAAEQGSE
jgi:hypothetical protein